MTCNMCPDEADCFVQCQGSPMCFCHFCVELWWCLWNQPSVEAFYGSP